jgi:uncharacterized protein YtpQ (UPF0354 family)
MSALTREQFVEHVLKMVPEKFPLVKLSRGEAPFSMRVNGHVVSLENIYRMAVLRPEEMRHNIERWVVELLRAAEGSPDRTGSFDELRERILPMVLPERAGKQPREGNDEEDDPHRGVVSQPLVEGLYVAYAIDSDRTIAYIPQAHFDTWGVTLDDLHEAAMENLVRRSETMSAHAAQDEEGKINLILFQTMDGYDASRLLLPTLHERLREHLGSPFAAGIPNRDILLCFRNDEETVGRLKGQIAEDFRNMPHQITEKLVLVTADGIALRSDSPSQT